MVAGELLRPRCSVTIRQRLQNVSSNSTSLSDTFGRGSVLKQVNRTLSAYLFALISGTRFADLESLILTIWDVLPPSI